MLFNAESESGGKKRFCISVWWIKRDARLDDNPALTAAIQSSKYVIPVAIFEPNVWSSSEHSELHRSCWLSAIAALNKNLELRGSRLLFMATTAEAAFKILIEQFKVEAIFSHEEIGSESTYGRDRRVKSYLTGRNIPWIEIPQSGVVRGLRSRDKRNKIWATRVTSPPLPIPENLSLPSGVISQLPTHDEILKLSNSSVTERIGRTVLRSFLETRGQGYSGRISSPNTAFESGSRLSEHLAWGTLSVRRVYYESICRTNGLEGDLSPEARRWRRSLHAFRSRLHWRDHFIQRLESEPKMEYFALNRAYEAVSYEDDVRLLNAWLTGTTGAPLVDACMRCLQNEGFLNFRMRAMVVSYACHVLHLSWKTIMHPLAALFIDYEPGIHISQLQMQAGVVGINTIRIYNPTKQLMEQDSEAIFVKKWVPELRGCSAAQIFEHEVRPILGYTATLVNYKERVELSKKQLYGIKGLAETQKVAKVVLEKHGSRMKPVRRKAKVRVNTAQLSFGF